MDKEKDIWLKKVKKYKKSKIRKRLTYKTDYTKSFVWILIGVITIILWTYIFSLLN